MLLCFCIYLNFQRELAALQARAEGSKLQLPKGAPMSLVVANAAALPEGDEGAEDDDDDDSVSIPSSNDNKEVSINYISLFPCEIFHFLVVFWFVWLF